MLSNVARPIPRGSVSRLSYRSVGSGPRRRPGTPGWRAIVGALMLAAGPSAVAQSPPVTQVKVERVQSETLQDRRQVTGSLRASARAEVAALEEGRLVAIHVREADTVNVGDPIAEVDSRRIRAEIAEVEADGAIQAATIRQRQAELTRAQREYNRLLALQGSAAATVQELEDAESRRDVAQALLEAAQRQADQIDRRRDILQVRLEDTRLVAPFAGRVVQQHVEIGEWIDPGDPVITLIADERVEAWLDVPERYKIDVRGGVEEIDIEVLAANEVVRSEQARVVPQLDPRIRNFTLIAELDNSTGNFAAGMSVVAWIPLGEASTYLTVPKRAVLRGETGWTVIVARPSQDSVGNLTHTAAHLVVQRAFETPTRFIIAAGNLNTGDLVVTEGNERLAPGQPLQIVASTSEAVSDRRGGTEEGAAASGVGE